MMKKVLYGVALTLFAGVSVGSLQSCKDDVNDLKTQTSFDLKQLQLKVEERMNDLQRQITENREDIDDLYQKLNEYATLKYVNNLIYGADEANGQIGEGGLLGMINGALDRIDNIEDILGIPDGYLGYDNVIEYLKGKVGAQQQSIQEILDFLGYGNDLTGQEKTLKEVLEEMNGTLEDLQNQLDELTNEEGTGRVDVLEDKVTEMDELMTKMINQMNKQVTGILIQGVYSPVFGDFRLPIGVKSNILFNWYGKNERNKDITFPSNDFNANGDVNVDFAALNPQNKFTAVQGLYGDVEATEVAGLDPIENSITLGKVYVTLNPVGVEFDDLTVYLETSAGTRLPWSVTLNPSDYELTHGYTRTVENGFYEGELKVPVEEAINGETPIEYEIEAGLKTAMKDALKDPSRVTATALVKAVYDQLSGKVPAYALRYDWYTSVLSSDPDAAFSQKANAVLSQYDLAVATAKPLGYNFLSDYEGPDNKFREFGQVQNFINKLIDKTLDKINIEGKNITVNPGNYAIGFGSVKFYEGDNGELLADVEGLTVNGKAVELKGFDCGTPEDAAAAVTEAIKDAIKAEIVAQGGEMSDALEADINTKVDLVLLQMQSQINEVVESINGQIQNALNSIRDEFEPYYGKLNKAVEIYNKIARKLNKFLSNPNAYLQVAAFYDMGDDYGIVSGKASDPTPFEGDGEAFKLYLSSYTGELIVPACKKYVAITAAPAGVDLETVNTGDLNTVLDGNKVEVSVAKPSVKGVYEFTYQALDYRGYTSTKKFYIEVK